MSKIEPPRRSKDEIIELSKLIYKNINQNINQIQPIFDINIESETFFYGILARLQSLVTDISCLLSNRYNTSFTSIFILSRVILDDFATLHYICNSVDIIEEITKLNADAHDKTIKKVSELADLNENFLNGKFPHYPTHNVLTELKKVIINKSDSDKYFINKEEMRFKKFLTMRDLIVSYKGKDSYADLSRLYFRWRQLSDYVHYSKFSYDYDVQNQNPEYQYNDVEEFLLYAYFGCKLIMKQFERKYPAKHIPNEIIDNLEINYFSSINL